MFKPQANRPFRQTLLLSAIVIGFTTFGAVILYAVTEWLWLVVHQGLRTKSAFNCFKSWREPLRQRADKRPRQLRCGDV